MRERLGMLTVSLQELKHLIAQMGDAGEVPQSLTL